MKLPELTQENINSIGKFFFPSIDSWEIYPTELLCEDAKWNGIDIVPLGHRFPTSEPLKVVQINLNEDIGFAQSVFVYSDPLGDITFDDPKLLIFTT